ncbi:hypothetical protein HY251_16820, partial [bacterium]|nr:hypothetical protein [bacterium]
EDMPRLFREFEQISPTPGTLAARPEGSGLGLFLSQRLVLLHGGTILVASEWGKGTTVTVHLPLDSANQAKPPPAPRSPAFGTSAAVVRAREESSP